MLLLFLYRFEVQIEVGLPDEEGRYGIHNFTLQHIYLISEKRYLIYTLER